MSGFIGKIKPQLCIISEFGEELSDLRVKVADGLTKALGVRCIAADVGTEISFPKEKDSSPRIRCVICGRFENDIIKTQIINATIIYYCQTCSKLLRLNDKLNDYIKGERWGLWEQA